MDFVDSNSPYHILVISIILYLLAYERRVDRGVRDMKINLLLEKILFPFSKMGKAALISIIIAAYIDCSLPVSYIAIVYMIAVGCIGYGCERLIALITILLTNFYGNTGIKKRDKFNKGFTLLI